jgi:branched-chain amino acid transport system substrate-binding protein
MLIAFASIAGSPGALSRPRAPCGVGNHQEEPVEVSMWGASGWTRSARIGAWLLVGCIGLASGALTGTAAAQDKVIKIGQLGVMSGPEASWGLINKYTAMAHIKMINEDGGFVIDGQPYKLELVSIDTKNDPRVAIAGAERLVYQEHIKYIIGPNVDETSRAVIPVLADGGAFNVSYGWQRELFSPPSENTSLGMVAGYQSAPVIYKYLRDKKGVKTISCLPRNDTSGLNSRDNCVAAAKALGLKILSSDSTYEPGTTDFFPVVGRVIEQNPDLLVLSGVAPSDAPLIIRAAREQGYKGLMSTETAMDAKILSEVAGDLANGFISVGGASAPEIRTKYMQRFIDDYKKVAGEWNDEAGTKVYALEILLNTIKAAGPKALDNVDAFKAEMASFSMPNPYLKGDKQLKYVGSKYFGQPRQISVPMVVNVFQDGKFNTLFVGSVE